MIFPSVSLALLSLASTIVSTAGQCVSPGKLVCKRTETPPTLDGQLDDWSSVETTETSLTAALGATPYAPGNLKMRCLYDDLRIYFAFEIPGDFRFSTEDNHLCAAVATMAKIGADAKYVNMGGCPFASASAAECTAVSGECDSYRVDIGGHWELRTTEMGVTYPINVGEGADGNDLVANKDDEYAVGPFCRFDDDDEAAGNEWAGAWQHTSRVSVSEETATSVDGSYIFELSRLLTTNSTLTDAQFTIGKSHDFGFSYWDPNENEATGWSDAGHYVTGCSMDWIDLILDDGSGIADDAPVTAPTDDGSQPDDSPIVAPTEATQTSGAFAVSVLTAAVVGAFAASTI